MTDVSDSASRYRQLRRELEENILPLATSLDGRRFEFQCSLHGLEVAVGGYVALEQGDERRLGEVIELEAVEVDGPEFGGTAAVGGVSGGMRMKLRAARGHGVIYGGASGPFHDALMRPAEQDEVRNWLDETRPRRAALTVGELARAPGVPFSLDAGGFGGTRSSAASPAPERPTRSGSCSSGCSSRPGSGS